MPKKMKLLVHLTYPKRVGGPSLLDRTNDPEMRLGLPMTFGDCRPNVRRQAHIGDVLIFIAHVPDDPLKLRYYLDAYFKVAEILDQGEALARFGSRPNVLIEELSNNTAIDEIVSLNGIRYQHATDDDHADWAHRVRSPYLVSDTAESRIVRPGIPWADLVRECPTLRPVEALKTKFNRHPPALISNAGASFLETRIKQYG